MLRRLLVLTTLVLLASCTTLQHSSVRVSGEYTMQGIISESK
jgi:hypothetical protein